MRQLRGTGAVPGNSRLALRPSADYLMSVRGPPFATRDWLGCKSERVAAMATAASYRARYSDGLSAVAHEATVRLGVMGLEIYVPGAAGGVVKWPYASLRAGQPIGRRLQPVVITSGGQERATLYVDDAALLRRLGEVVPALTARHVRLRKAAPWIIAVGAAALVALIVWGLQLSPARTIAGMLPERARQAIGKQTIESMTHDRQLCVAPDGKVALEHLTQRLLTGAPGAPQFRLVVIDWGLVNAFATAGSQIVLTRGLIAGAQSPDEVAGVLAHEMGHGIELHPESAIVRAIGLTAAVELILGGGGLTNIGLTLAQLSYSREAEREADAQAIAILRGARISQRGLLDFLDRAEKRRKEKTDGLSKSIGDIGVLRTHPVTAERKRMIEESPTYAATPALDAAEWQALQAICSVTRKP